jgi:hypothetical protein
MNSRKIGSLTLLIMFLGGCMTSSVLSERFAAECQKAGFKKGSNVYKLCVENKKDIYKIEQANSLRNLNNTNASVSSASGNSVSFSATFRLN